MLINRADLVFSSVTIQSMSIRMILQLNVLISAHLECMGIIPIWIIRHVCQVAHQDGIKITLLGHALTNVLNSLPIMLILLLDSALINAGYKWKNSHMILTEHALPNALQTTSPITTQEDAY